jgi:hypothetical protein
MTISMHALSAPIYVALLNNLNAWLDKAEALAIEKKFDIEVLLSARLAPDMFDLRRQIQVATGWAKNCQCRLAGQTPPDFPDTERTIAELRARIARTLDIVQSITEKDLQGSETRTVEYNLGPDFKMSQPGLEYLTRVALPTFWFHVVTAYDILRHNGVTLGKQDYMVGLFSVPGR